MNESLFLNTTGNLFIQWLIEDTHKVMDQLFPTETGVICLQPAVRMGSTSTGSGMLQMDGFYTRPAEEGPETPFTPLSGAGPGIKSQVLEERLHYMHEHAHYVTGLITFEVTPLVGKHTKVQAECRHPWVEGYFQELLAKIKKLWPESAKGRAPWVAPAPEPPLVSDEPRTPKQWSRTKRRDDEILKLRVQGKTQAEVAKLKHISIKTVQRAERRHKPKVS